MADSARSSFVLWDTELEDTDFKLEGNYFSVLNIINIFYVHGVHPVVCHNNKRVYSPSPQQMFTRIFVLLHVSVSQDHHHAKLTRLQKSFLFYQ
jgi:hypothetical protein